MCLAGALLLGDLDHKNVQQDWQVRPGINFELAAAVLRQSELSVPVLTQFL
jgi:hypothetical protein